MRVDITGQRFEKLVVMKFAGASKHRQAMWLCKCDCGKETTTSGASLRQGLTRSCGCLHIEAAKKPNRRTHGQAAPDSRRTRTYNIWTNMKQRCSNPTASSYINYGGRGIRVCKSWMKFENFYADMGDCPPLHEIDRIDNDGDYELANCRWVTKSQNNASGRRRPKKHIREKEEACTGTIE